MTAQSVVRGDNMVRVNFSDTASLNRLTELIISSSIQAIYRMPSYGRQLVIVIVLQTVAQASGLFVTPAPRFVPQVVRHVNFHDSVWVSKHPGSRQARGKLSKEDAAPVAHCPVDRPCHVYQVYQPTLIP